MITQFLLRHSGVVPVVLLAVAAACVGIGTLVLRSRGSGRRTLPVLTALSLLPVAALTLTPAVARVDRIVCTVQLSLPTLGAVELLANIAMFFPAGYFATLASRRPLAVLVAGALASAVVETVQASLPFLGRACDTTDWVMNVTGVGLAVAAGAASLALARPGQTPGSATAGDGSGDRGGSPPRPPH